MEDTNIPLDKLVKIYRKIKMEIDTLTQEYDTKIEVLKSQQDEIKFEIKDQMKALGVTFVKSPFGTVSMRTSTTYTTNDWASFKDFVLEHGAVDLLFKRIAQANMAQFLKRTRGSTTGTELCNGVQHSRNQTNQVSFIYVKHNAFFVRKRTCIRS